MQQLKGENGESPHPLTDYKNESLIIGEYKTTPKPENNQKAGSYINESVLFSQTQDQIHPVVVEEGKPL